MNLMLLLLVTVMAADPPRPFTTADSPPEYGYGLTAEEARDGWISLFDGQTTFGWKNAGMEHGLLTAGETTAQFGAVELKGEAITSGELFVGGKAVPIPAGSFKIAVSAAALAPIRLGDGLKLKSLLAKPLNLQPKYNGQDLDGWKALKHPRLSEDRQTKWRVENGAIHVTGGPGALELDGLYGDFVIQVEGRTRARLVNGGVFFRAVPGDFLNGYEAQVFHSCYEGDPAQPARYSTGAIDDRQLARRLVSRDKAPFTMTILARGPHIATWVNGYPMIDWTDTRPDHENPRIGLRLKAGAIQLQAHDPETDLEFREIRLGELQ